MLSVHIICIEPPVAFLRPALDAKPGDEIWPDSQPREESPFFGEFPPDEVADTQMDTPEKSPRPAFVRMGGNCWENEASPPLPSTPVQSHGERYAFDDEETKPANHGLEPQSAAMGSMHEEPVNPKSLPMDPELEDKTGLPPPPPQVPVEDLVSDADGEGPKPDDSQSGGAKPKCKAKGKAKSMPKKKASKPPKVLTEEQKQQKRVNSQIWHTKWVSKGVPKNPKNLTPGDAGGAETASSSSGSTGVQYAGSLSAARDKFIKCWIDECGLPKSNDRRNRAMKAWMASSQRAELLAARIGTQM